MQKKIILHGSLAALYPHEILVEASSVAEALRSLATIPELTPTQGRGHLVQIDGIDSEVALYAITDLEEIHIRPRTGGAGGNNPGLMQVLIGVVFVALAVANPALLGVMGLSKGMLFLSGGLMIAGGLLQMLLPTPQDEGPTKQSRNFTGGEGNSTVMGTPITLAYGFNRLGGQYLSFDIDAKDYSGLDDEMDDGTASSEDDVVYVKHDATSLSIAPILPIFATSVPGSGNVPTSAWVP